MIHIIKYLRYITIHKWYVMIECFKRGLFLQGLLHDISKLRPDEFFPYLDSFYKKDLFPEKSMVYKVKTKETIKESFDLAWLKHIHRNPHHWQYWILQYDEEGIKCLEMPEKYVKEMVADWIGAGIAITGKRDVLGWYDKNKDNIKLNIATRMLVEYYLGLRDVHGCKFLDT